MGGVIARPPRPPSSPLTLLSHCSPIPSSDSSPTLPLPPFSPASHILHLSLSSPRSSFPSLFFYSLACRRFSYSHYRSLFLRPSFTLLSSLTSFPSFYQSCVSPSPFNRCLTLSHSPFFPSPHALLLLLPPPFPFPFLSHPSPSPLLSHTRPHLTVISSYLYFFFCLSFLPFFLTFISCPFLPFSFPSYPSTDLKVPPVLCGFSPPHTPFSLLHVPPFLPFTFSFLTLPSSSFLQLPYPITPPPLPLFLCSYLSFSPIPPSSFHIPRPPFLHP